MNFVNIHTQQVNRWVVFMIIITLVQLFMPYRNFEGCNCENVGGGIGHDPATEATLLGLNQLPVYTIICTDITVVL